MKRILCGLILVGLLGADTPLAAQGLSAGVSRWFKKPHVWQYSLGVGGFGLGPFKVTYVGQYLKQADSSKAHWYGAGAELAIPVTPTAQPYIIGGAAVGAGRGPTGGGEAPGIGAWGGVGAELFALGPLGLQAEALYQWRSKVHLNGLSLGLKVGLRLGKAQPARQPLPPMTPPPVSGAQGAGEVLPRAAPADEEVIRRATMGALPAATAAPATPRGPAATPAAAEIITTAVQAMGAPYRWGGNDSNGFDCSGLIRYAYAEHGIAIPRLSTDQARAGSEVGRELSSLLPGDILTFASAPGGTVAHVGLYVGEGRFIHSARNGVQISILREDDPGVRWWWDRWVGARRVLGT